MGRVHAPCAERSTASNRHEAPLGTAARCCLYAVDNRAPAYTAGSAGSPIPRGPSLTGVFAHSAAIYDAIYSFKDYAAEAAMIDATIRSRAPDARTLLDVACGTGRHLEHLRARYDVAGLDADANLLEIARARNPGVALHGGDMVDFELDAKYDAVTCLFSSIGYTLVPERLDRAVAAMARHLTPGGVLVVEPWFFPEHFQTGHLGAVFVDEPDLKVARMNTTEATDGISRLYFHYLVGTPEGIASFTEEHEVGLFEDARYRAAFERAGLAVDYDPEGPMGRGLYVAVAPR